MWTSLLMDRGRRFDARLLAFTSGASRIVGKVAAAFLGGNARASRIFFEIAAAFPAANGACPRMTGTISMPTATW